MSRHTTPAKRVARTCVAVIAVAAFCATWAVAQDPVAAAPAGGAGRSVSMWSIIADGIEWPAWLILIGSLAAIALIIEHFINVRTATIAPPEQARRARQLIEHRKYRECLDKMRNSSTFFAVSMTAALRHARHGHDAMHAAAMEKTSELAGQMFRKVEYLNILGNLGPLMGLLGTVYGMIIAFSALGAGGGEAGSDAGSLARGISLALVNTLLGLMLAIVGLGFFGWCRNRVDSLTMRATVQVLDLLEYFRPAAAGASPGASSAEQRPLRDPAVEVAAHPPPAKPAARRSP